MKKLSYYRKNLSEFNTDQKEIFKVIDKKINEIKIKNKI